jgi:hypothetical protein
MIKNKSYIWIAVILWAGLMSGAAIAGNPSTRQVVFFVQ